MKTQKVWHKAVVTAALVGVAAYGVRAQDNMNESGMNQSMTRGMDSGMMGMKSRNATMLINTLSEEKTEINQLSAQRMALMKMGGRQNMRVARMLGRWIAEHKAAGPTLMALTRRNGGDPMAAKIMKPPVLGETQKMLHATMVDHMKAEMTSQMRFSMTNSGAVKRAMHKRAMIARKHMNQMHPYHNASNCPMCADMMKNGGMKM